jgi:hypothetical protein
MILLDIQFSLQHSPTDVHHSRKFDNSLFLNKNILLIPNTIFYHDHIDTRLIFPDVSLKENLTFMHYSFIDRWSVWLRDFESAKLHCSVREMAWWRKIVELMLPCYG